MSNEFTNPFVLPGAGQDGEAAHNPLFAGLEMMRQAWQGMAGNGFEAQGVPLMSIEDLDRRIGELRSVQNWLQLNVSILGNTIQGLEIQRATLSTLRAFADHGLADAQAWAAGVAKGTSGAASPAAAGTSRDQDKGATDPDDVAHDTDPAAAAQAYAQAAGQWWNLLQQQFQSLADATAATLQGASEPSGTASDVPPAGSKTAGKSADRSAAKKTNAPRATKAAAKSKTTGSASRAGTSRGKPRA